MKTTLDSTTIAKIQTQSDMNEFVSSLGLTSKTVIVKPNWIDALNGTHTDAKVLDLLLTSLSGKKIYIVESYTFWRTKEMTDGGKDCFSSKEADFEKGKQHWQHFQKQDQWFLKYTGIDKVLEKHNATYLNVTNELWQENSQDLIPQKINLLAGSDFISLAKLKGDGEYGATLSIKNFFGLYPDPKRNKYHGEDDEKVQDSILKINQIYQKLFNCFFIVEGVFTASHVDWENKGSQSFKDFGIILGGKDGYEVDSYALKLMGRQFSGALIDLLPNYKKIFGGSFSNLEIPENLKINFSIKL